MIPYEYITHIGIHEGHLRILSSREEFTPPPLVQKMTETQVGNQEELIGQMSVVMDRVEVVMQEEHAKEVVEVVKLLCGYRE